MLASKCLAPARPLACASLVLHPQRSRQHEVENTLAICVTAGRSSLVAGYGIGPQDGMSVLPWMCEEQRRVICARSTAQISLCWWALLSEGYMRTGERHGSARRAGKAGKDERGRVGPECQCQDGVCKDESTMSGGGVRCWKHRRVHAWLLAACILMWAMHRTHLALRAGASLGKKRCLSVAKYAVRISGQNTACCRFLMRRGWWHASTREACLLLDGGLGQWCFRTFNSCTAAREGSGGERWTVRRALLPGC